MSFKFKIMRRLIVISAIFFFFSLLVYCYYEIRKSNSEDIFKQKAILNNTNQFFNKVLRNNEIGFDTILKKIGDDYEVKIRNKYQMIIVPNALKSSDFYGYEVRVDSTKNKIDYIGLYKP